MVFKISKNFAFLCFWTKVASALEGLKASDRVGSDRQRMLHCDMAALLPGGTLTVLETVPNIQQPLKGDNLLVLSFFLGPF